MSSDIPSGKLKRSGLAAMTAARVGARQLSHVAKRPFLSAENRDQHEQETDAANAKVIFNALTQLRGTALKIAQMLSMETDMLPERYRHELAKSYYQVPPLNRALIRKVVRQELGHAPDQVFASFDTQAFAAASLGQVHNACAKDGLKLAIKVQYPGIDATIKSDIQMVRQLIKHMQGYESAGHALSEIETRMQEETDYQLEADNIRWFDQHLKMGQVIIPAVYDQWSSKHLLSMEKLEGKHLQEWLATNPPQQQRNQAAQTIYDIYIRSVFELNRFHADPNPGNYLFCEDGKLGLIDFGCVKTLTARFAVNLSTLYQAVVVADTDTLLDTYRELGMLKSDSGDGFSNAYFDTILSPFFDWVSRPFKCEYFDFAANAGYAAESLKLLENIRKHKGFDDGYLVLNSDFVFTDRTLYGLYKIFEQMGATVRMQNRWTSA